MLQPLFDALNFPMEHQTIFIYGIRMVTFSEVSVVACGGALGASLRFLVGRFCELTWKEVTFPLSTLFVNIVGCLLIGLIAGYALRGGVSPLARLLLTTGILGGFTTFSAFGLEAVTLLRAGHFATFLVYILGSVLGGCVGVWLGLILTESSAARS